MTSLDVTKTYETQLISAALDLLEKRLDKLYLRTSFECRELVDQLLDTCDEWPPPVIVDLGPELTPALRKLRDGFIDCITETYQHLSNAVKSADKAKELLWSAIDQFFHWSADRASSKRLKDWLCRCGTESLEDYFIDRTWFALDRLDIEPYTRSSGGLLESLIVEDFRNLIERTIAELWDEAFLKFSSLRNSGAVVSPEELDFNADGIQGDFVYSSDYRTIRLKGEAYRPTPQQALIFKELHEAQSKGLPGVSAALLRRKLGASRIRDSFRSGDGPKLWSDLIDHTGRMYALKLPRY